MELLSTLGVGAIVLAIIFGGAAVWKMVRELLVSGRRRDNESPDADEKHADN
ncbi:hypothetical protein [Curtobacterium sp. B18]|uniref:hypothetical protein n=1 Tax=Curtobacterium sp. B18 TaxID=95614 RepID=UPI0016518BC6|nr:hypothetical protein [Curtobacterium sp. B18]